MSNQVHSYLTISVMGTRITRPSSVGTSIDPPINACTHTHQSMPAHTHYINLTTEQSHYSQLTALSGMSGLYSRSTPSLLNNKCSLSFTINTISAEESRVNYIQVRQWHADTWYFVGSLVPLFRECYPGPLLPSPLDCDGEDLLSCACSTTIIIQYLP